MRTTEKASDYKYNSSKFTLREFTCEDILDIVQRNRGITGLQYVNKYMECIYYTVGINAGETQFSYVVAYVDKRNKIIIPMVLSLNNVAAGGTAEARCRENDQELFSNISQKILPSGLCTTGKPILYPNLVYTTYELYSYMAGGGTNYYDLINMYIRQNDLKIYTFEDYLTNIVSPVMSSIGWVMTDNDFPGIINYLSKINKEVINPDYYLQEIAITIPTIEEKGQKDQLEVGFESEGYIDKPKIYPMAGGQFKQTKFFYVSYYDSIATYIPQFFAIHPGLTNKIQASGYKGMLVIGYVYEGPKGFMNRKHYDIGRSKSYPGITAFYYYPQKENQVFEVQDLDENLFTSNKLISWSGGLNRLDCNKHFYKEFKTEDDFHRLTKVYENIDKRIGNLKITRGFTQEAANAAITTISGVVG